MLKPAHKLTQFLVAFLKVAVVICVCYFIYERLANHGQFEIDQWFTAIKVSGVLSFNILLALTLLSVGNWLLEIKKWQFLASKVSEISFKESVKQSLASHTLALITPFRSGEYGVKALYFSTEKRKRILGWNLFGHANQMAVTICFGLVGGYLVVSRHFSEWFWIYFSAVILVVLFAFFGTKKLLKAVKVSKAFSFQIIGLSVFRYLLFAHQFYMLLLAFDVELSYILSMSIIASTYLVASCIPILNVFDVALKGSVAIFLFSLFGVDALPIFCISLVMWLLNMVLPALIGSGLLLQSILKVGQLYKRQVLSDA